MVGRRRYCTGIRSWERLEGAVGGEARLIPGGPEEVGRVGVLTGGGASFLEEAVAAAWTRWSRGRPLTTPTTRPWNWG